MKSEEGNNGRIVNFGKYQKNGRTNAYTDSVEESGSVYAKAPQEFRRKRVDKKKFVRYEEACEIYSMCLPKLRALARDAGAVYKLNRMVLISIDKMDEYIESFLHSK